MQKMIAGLVLFFYSLAAFALTATETEIVKTGQLWQQAIDSRNANQVAVLYAHDAFLYPTFENIKDTPKQRWGYFDKIAQNDDLKVVFNTQHIQIYDNVAVSSGFYTFSYKKDGKEISAPARYTFVYVHQGNHWLIVNHHSSVLPKP